MKSRVKLSKERIKKKRIKNGGVQLNDNIDQFYSLNRF